MATRENSRKNEFEGRIEQLLSEARVCSKGVEVEIGRLSGMKGELSGIQKELERTKMTLGRELSDEDLDDVSDAVAILKEELEAKRKKTEEMLRGEEAKKAEEYLTDLKYLKAEFENYKRRAEKEKRKFADYLIECFVIELLPIEDNLEAAIAHAKENDKSEGLLKGVEMTVRQFKELLENEGLEEIKAEGAQFDPFRHEVVSKEINETHPENTVIEVNRKGYAFREKVIRPAMVKIAIKGDD